ncbi:hypothetical protein [Streptomyces luteolifulvus]|jgi:hypothetical protein|nr:hypothetical protein [Streptomyces luteolifulvus]
MTLLTLLALVLPLVLLGLVLALGRYEEWLLPPDDTDRHEPAAPV